jgi:hypothetical protein
MVGLIYRTLFSLIESTAGHDAVAEVKRRANVPADKAFLADVAYEDTEWQRLFANACDVLHISHSQAERSFADFFCRDALQRWPTWFAKSHSAREFLERQPKIHHSFATAVRNPATRKEIADKFNLEKRDTELVMHYKSPNQLCGLYTALAQWLISHYGDQAAIEETRCIKRGDPECEIHIHWPPPGVS